MYTSLDIKGNPSFLRKDYTFLLIIQVVHFSFPFLVHYLIPSDNDKRNKIYKALCEIGITDIRPPKRTKIIRDYLQGHFPVIRFLILILLLAIFYYHFF